MRTSGACRSIAGLSQEQLQVSRLAGCAGGGGAGPHVRAALRALLQQALGVLHDAAEVVVVEPAQLGRAAQQLHQRRHHERLQARPAAARPRARALSRRAARPRSPSPRMSVQCLCCARSRHEALQAAPSAGQPARAPWPGPMRDLCERAARHASAASAACVTGRSALRPLCTTGRSAYPPACASASTPGRLPRQEAQARPLPQHAALAMHGWGRHAACVRRPVTGTPHAQGPPPQPVCHARRERGSALRAGMRAGRGHAQTRSGGPRPRGRAAAGRRRPARGSMHACRPGARGRRERGGTCPGTPGSSSASPALRARCAPGAAAARQPPARARCRQERRGARPRRCPGRGRGARPLATRLSVCSVTTRMRLAEASSCA